MEESELHYYKAVYEHQKTRRKNVEAIWDQIEKFVDPLGSGRMASAGADSEDSVTWKRIEVWDFTAIEGSQKLTATLHMNVTSPAARWFGAAFRDADLQKDKESLKWLEAVCDDAFRTLQDSDFNVEVAKADGALVNYGNCFVIEEEEGDGAADFTCIPVREAYWEPDSKSGMKAFFRRLDWTALQIVDHCTGEDGLPEGVPDKILQEVKTPEGRDTIHEVVFLLYPREGAASGWSDEGEPVVLAPDKRRVGAVYFLAETAEQLGDEDGYYSWPAFWAPWLETAGSQWGHGIGGLVLPGVKLLNAFDEADLGAVEKVVDPAVLVQERGLLSDLDLGPSGMTVVRDIENAIKVFESGAKFEVTAEKIANLQAAIRRAFHGDELTLRDSPAMTATEVQVRYELMLRILGSSLSRIETNLLSPVVLRTIEIRYRAGKLPPVPALVKKKKGQINIEYLGPLARAQRSDDVVAIERTASFVGALVKMGIPEPLDVFDAAAAVRLVAQRLGCPPELLRDEMEVKKLQAARDKALAVEQARRQGEAAEQVANARAAMAGAGGTTPAAPPPILTPTYPG